MENKNIASTIEKLSTEELKTLLGELKQYQDLTKKLGTRGTDLFKRELTGAKLLVVEYFPTIGEESAFAQAELVYKTIFGSEVKKETIHFVPKQELLGGIKVYSDDNMIDMSFSKIEKHIKG